MTEAPKGLMTSKELGMAVADRLRQAEKRPETPGSEPTPKQEAHRRRMLQPPTREQQADGHVAVTASLTPIKEAQPAPTQENSPDVRTERELAEEKWANKFLEEMAFNPDAKATDAEWERLYRLDDITQSRVNYSVEFKRSLRHLKEGVGRRKGYSEDKMLEIAARYAEGEREKTEEWAKVGIRRLPGEVWVKKIQNDENKCNEKTDEEKKQIYKERLQRGESAFPRGETDSRLYQEAQAEFRRQPYWTRERVNDVRAGVHGLPPFTDEEWKEYERKWKEYDMRMERRVRRGQMTVWEVIGEMVVDFLADASHFLKDKSAEKK